MSENTDTQTTSDAVAEDVVEVSAPAAEETGGTEVAVEAAVRPDGTEQDEVDDDTTDARDDDDVDNEDAQDDELSGEESDGHSGEESGEEGRPTRSGAARRAELEREGEVAADFLETLLDICDLDGDLDVDVDGDRAAVAIVDSDEGRVPRRLVGQNGTVLEALQELTRLAVQSATGVRTRLMLDVAGHRAGRRSELMTTAQAVIAEVKESGERRSLEPMSAFERKVVHDEVLAAGLVSESEGAEPRRFVVIHPA